MRRGRPQRQAPSVRVQGATPQMGTCEEKQQCLKSVPRNDYEQLPLLKHFFHDSVVHEFTRLRVNEFKSRNQNCPAQRPTAARMQ
jgi:hypothetical protein